MASGHILNALLTNETKPIGSEVKKACDDDIKQAYPKALL